jgi:glycosyltransferase involved in cell wall biosynthesis
VTPPDRRRSPASLDVVFVEPFLGGSHAAFAEGWIERSRHRWRLLSLPGERWKWRMRTAAMALGPRLAALDPPPDAVVAAGLMDLAHLRQLAGPAAGRAPHLLYLHENQLSYPRPAREPLDRGFAVAHVASLLAADAVAFNSRAHRDAMRTELRAFLDEVPTPRPRGVLARVSPKRTRILPPGVDLTGFPDPAARPPGDPPVIAWNHRWEEDKRPSAFARILLDLAERGLDFRLVLLGPVDQVHPRPLELIRERLAPRILRDGPARTRAEYVAWLARADLAVSVASQENFGYAAVEAMAAGAVPLLPNRLSYPELLTPKLRETLLYGTDRDLRERLAAWLRDPAPLAPLRRRVMRGAHRHAWDRRVEALDDWVAQHV